MGEQMVAHETAHQWWGDLVNWAGYRDQWIMEALANYSALMLLESHDPVKFHEIMQAYRDDLLVKNEKGDVLMDAGPVSLGFRLSSSRYPGAYEPICYGRGTWLFHMLRTMMRDGQEKAGAQPRLEDEPFIRALRKLRRDYADKSINNATLMTVFESELPESLSYEGHKSLDWFYEGWVNGKAIPGFALHDVKFTERGKITLVSGSITQNNAPDTLVTSVPIYANVAGKNVFLKRIFAEGTETQFHITAPAGTRKLVIDPEKTLLSRAK
jgi:aminopeptidase N